MPPYLLSGRSPAPPPASAANNAQSAPDGPTAWPSAVAEAAGSPRRQREEGRPLPASAPHLPSAPRLRAYEVLGNRQVTDYIRARIGELSSARRRRPPPTASHGRRRRLKWDRRRLGVPGRCLGRRHGAVVGRQVGIDRVDQRDEDPELDP